MSTAPGEMLFEQTNVTNRRHSDGIDEAINEQIIETGGLQWQIVLRRRIPSNVLRAGIASAKTLANLVSDTGKSFGALALVGEQADTDRSS